MHAQDKDGSGAININELGDAFKLLGESTAPAAAYLHVPWTCKALFAEEIDRTMAASDRIRESAGQARLS